MKISVVCLASRSGGGLTILRELYSFARNSDKQHMWQFILSDQVLGEDTERVTTVNAAPEYRGWLSRLKGEITVGRRAINNFNPDIVLSLQNTDTLARGNHPLAIYLHQALPFQTQYRLSPVKRGERHLAWRQYILKWPILFSTKKATKTFVQTRWLAESVRREAPEASVVTIGFNHTMNRTKPSEEIVSDPYFFYPASGAPYKNHRILHEAAKLLSGRGVNMIAKLAVTLRPGQLLKCTGSQSFEEKQWYRPLGWLTTEEVFDHYAKSILVFPSLVESLGLPLYEARQMNAPIVAADSPYAKEALENYPFVYWFDPTNPESLAAAMEESLTYPRPAWSKEEESVDLHDSWQIMLEELQKAVKIG